MTQQHQFVAPSLRERRGLVLAFVVVFLLGAPVWWFVTRVERVQLPYAEIAQYTNGSASEQLCVPLMLTLRASQQFGQRHPHLDKLLPNSATRIVSQGGKSCVNVRWRVSEASQQHPGVGAVLHVPDEQQTDITLVDSTGTAHVYCAERVECQTKVNAFVQRVYGGQESWTPQITMQRTSGVEVLFSLLVADPANAPVSWDIQSAMETYMQPLLKPLHALGRFDLVSQVQYFAELPIQPSAGKSSAHFQLKAGDLPHFINSAEWNLASASSKQTSVHMVLFVPAHNATPLTIVDEGGRPVSSNAFMIPGWGGIAIYNPPQESNKQTGAPSRRHHLSTKELQAPMAVFATHIRQLLGIPGVLWAGTKEADIQFEPGHPFRLGALEVQLLQVNRISTALHDARQTLGAYVHLIDSLPSLPVNAHVAAKVRQSVQQVDAVRKLLMQPDAHSDSILLQATALASQARQLAEDAFFDSSMVGMVYFPDEHKYAVYLPLFLPMSFSIIGVFIKELKMWRAKRRGAKVKTE
ncbi:GPI transamidase component [Sorochytrium milnesiophthora]